MTAYSTLVRFIRPVRYLLNIFLWLCLLSFLVLFGLQFIHPRSLESLGVIQFISRWGNAAVTLAGDLLSWKTPAAKRYLPLGLALAAWVVQQAASATLLAFHRWLIQRAAVAPRVAPKPAPVAAPGGRPKTMDIQLGTLAPDSEKAREQLLNRYREIEQALKGARRKGCTFLSIDIVGSTQIKVGADNTDVTISFRAYEDTLKKILKEYGAWKQAWTPDGVMICFLQRELAVRAAQRVLQSLEHFNKTYNRLRTPFRLRCGINEGEVPIYEDSDLERVTDHIIDVAGHMQKQARTNSLWLSAEVFAQLADKSGFHSTGQEVDSFKVYAWSLEGRPAVAAPAAKAAAASAAAGAAVPAQPTVVSPHAGAPQATVLQTRVPPEGPPTQIGRYEIVNEMGRGAMGAVYKALDPRIGRTVAIKVILAKNLPSDALDEYKQRFTREAQAAGQMTHPGVVTIHDVGEDDYGQPFLVMEYLEGTPLDALTPPLPNVLEIAIQVARALDYAHQRGVTHRDIKPANILLSRDGRAKILDFGIARLAGTQLTQVGQILGTPAYMSPEQFTGASVDGRSDIFSLGGVLYWMCTGQQAFSGQSLAEVALKVIQTTPKPAHQLNPSLPPDVDAVIERCLAKDSEQRYQTGGAVAADLEAVLAGRPVVH
ncbi:MAG: protein kinase domain-containing protein [Candidatus Acidiferrales bacterium]